MSLPIDNTLPELLARRLRDSGDRCAMLHKRGGKFAECVWAEVASEVVRALEWFLRRGIVPGDRVAQVSENRREWIIVDLALAAIGAVHVPCHASLTGEQIAWQLEHSGARGVIFSTIEQLEKLRPCAERLPADSWGMVFEGAPPRSLGPMQVAAWTESLAEARGDGLDLIHPEVVRSRRPEDLATILYTSGTTGEPKGVMLTHGNLVSNAKETVAAYGDGPTDTRLLMLPLSHIYARTCDLYTWLVRGTRLALAESRDTILADCVAAKATLLNAVPYFYARVVRQLAAAGKLVPGAIRGVFGPSMRMLCCGGAPLAGETFDRYAADGLPILEGYGLSEASPVISVSTQTEYRRGAVGKPIEGIEVQIAADGELLTRGPHVMQGYWKDPAATSAVVCDGWLHTGDLGQFDADGFLHITGRKKELIVLASGKKVAPAHLENLLTQDPFVIQAFIAGDGRNYLSALIVPDPDRLTAEVRARGLWVWTKAGALAHADIQALYESIIRERLAALSPHEQVRRFTLMDRGFTIESGELTPKLSFRRAEIARNCAGMIDAMYRS